MTIRAKECKYLVKEPRSSSPRNHLWFEVLEGEDEGLRLSVPVVDSDYNEEILEKMQQLEEGHVVRVVLERENRQSAWILSDEPEIVAEI